MTDKVELPPEMVGRTVTISLKEYSKEGLAACLGKDDFLEVTFPEEVEPLPAPSAFDSWLHLERLERLQKEGLQHYHYAALRRAIENLDQKSERLAQQDNYDFVFSDGDAEALKELLFFLGES